MQTITGSLQGLGKVMSPVLALGVGAICKLILNLLLLPIKQIGIYGAIISSVVSQMISFIICLIALKRSIKIQFSWSKFIGKPILATIGMAICSYWSYLQFVTRQVFSKNIALFIAGLIGVIVYLFCIIVFKILSKEELFMMPYGKELCKKLENIRTL